ncbi:receptor-type tyrosine-protein phosphatase C isoform X1 [Lepidochelys kempii]|uniref:receptor-type tyrosine-protein phosphatase C isoform X1 n=1 Tax=Lepidochelys kempii TaxID=8472 RepID=UPI003C6F50B6
MTMFLWLELLAFGFALLDNNVFVKGKGRTETVNSPMPTSTSPLPARSTSRLPAGNNEGQTQNSTETGTIPPSSTNLSTHADSNSSFGSSNQPHSSTAALTSLTPATTTYKTSDASNPQHSHTTSPSVNHTPTSTQASISQPSSNTTLTTSTLTTETSTVTTKIPCETININLTYNYSGSTVTAELNISEMKSNYSIFCNSPCEVKGDQTIEGLKECETHEILIGYNECPNISHVIHIPPNGTSYRLQNNTPTSTSVQLSWTNVSDCKLAYNFACETGKDNQNITEPQKTLKNLSANKNYTCTGTIYYFENTVAQQTVNISTDYGKPEKLDTPKEENRTSENITFSWKAPQNISKGPIHGYRVNCTENVNASVNGTIFSCSKLKPYKLYNVSIEAYTVSKYSSNRFYGDAVTTKLWTKPAQPEKVTITEVKLISNNAVRIKCKEQSVNGELKNFTLVWEGKNETKKDVCEFHKEDLYYLKQYNFEIFLFNGEFKGDPVKRQVTTKYNSQALIIFLAFLIIVTSIALLIVLYKIYDLHREKLSNSGEDVMLVKRDDEKQLMNVEPIPAEMLLETYKRKIADEGRLFLDEFQSIPRVFSKFSIKEARKNYNQNKNRYIDILPYDYNRVELSEINGDPGSDYINASHIDGFKEPRKYIAAQGPKDETTDDFWRMIWEQKATIIVMVTRCEENNRNKCAQYWPTTENSTATFGDTVVKSNESKICPDYIIQKLHITNRKEKTPGRDVTHIQFTSWPDHGVPEDPHLLLKLRRRVNALSNFFSGPVVIHCSAGVGRTGTYIAIDAMLEGLEVEGRVDVYGYVVKLRRQRCLMVQVETQYILIHQALVEYNQFGETEVTVSELHTYLNNLKKRDPPSDPSLLEAEFQRLPSYRGWRSQNTGNRQENKSKNRNSKMIPYDFNRVPIKHEEEKSKESEHDSEESSDEDSDCEDASRYINASFITGYWGPKEMIATQGPLPETINDFWQMIFQRKVKVIVMLTELNEGDQQLCAQYWEEGKQRYEGIEVEMKDVNLSSSYTIRAFDVTHVKRKETRNVYMYQYHRWNGLDLPENPKDLVTMILNLKQKLAAKSVTEDSRYSRSVPIVIHCRDGSEQTGVFCALLTLLESAETEDVIDVFQVVKSLRRERPGMVPTFEQYQFLYDTVSSIYPAQNGQIKKNSKQEDTVEIDNEVEKTDQEANLITIDITSLESEANMNMEACEDSKSADGTQGTESSSNGPKTPVLTESA